MKFARPVLKLLSPTRQVFRSAARALSKLVSVSHVRMLPKKFACHVYGVDKYNVYHGKPFWTKLRVKTTFRDIQFAKKCHLTSINHFEGTYETKVIIHHCPVERSAECSDE